MNSQVIRFDQLSEALRASLSRRAGRALDLTLYPQGAAPDKAAGCRVEVPMYGWTAGFFFWRQPNKLPGVYHMLEVRCQFPQVKNMVFPLYSVVHQTAPEDLRCCCLTSITDEGEMDASVNWLWEILLHHQEAIDLLAQDPSPLLAVQKEELKASFGNDIHAPHSEYTLKKKLGGWYLTYHRRLTGVLYGEFLKGDPTRLRQSFLKEGPQNGFEEALLAHLLDHDGPQPTILSPALIEMMTREPRYPEGIHPTQRRSPWFLFGDLVVSSLILFPLWAVVYGLLFALDSHWAHLGVQFIIGMDWTEIIFCAWVSAFACSYLVTPQLIKLRYRTSPRLEEKLREANKLTTPQAQSIFKVFVWTAVTLTTAHLYFYAHSGLAFAEKGFYDRTGTMTIQGEYIPYSQVKSLALERETVEAMGQSLSSQDYVLTLKDGTKYYLGLNFGANSETVINELAPLLKAANPDSVNDKTLREG